MGANNRQLKQQEEVQNSPQAGIHRCEKVDAIFVCNQQPIGQIGVQERSPVCWSPDGNQYSLPSSLNSRLCYVNATHGLIICEIDKASSHFVQKMILTGHHHTVRALLYHPTQDLIVSSGSEGVFVWDLQSATCIKEIKFAFSLCFSTSQRDH